MLSIKETASASLRRLTVLNRILNPNSQQAPFSVMRKYYTADTSSEKTYVRVGNIVKELKPVKAPEKVPRGYLSLYNSTMTDSQVYLKYLRWLMQKDELRQDSFLIGSPPGAFRRNLALSFAELTQREVEYLCLTRDTTESDIKQRREVVSSSVIYANQCAVNAALNGRILIIEGIEKAERNLLPILNNLLENREINLDDGHFLVSPERYDKLVEIAKQTNNQTDLSNLNLLRVHEDFRVIAIGLPIPKYKGNSLDPPLRSRFQAHLVSFPAYEDFIKYLTSANLRVNPDLIKNLCDFGYSFYASEMASLNFPDFPLENLDKVVKIMNNCHQKYDPTTHYNSTTLNTGKLINKLYPYNLLFKDDETNKKFYFELMNKFNLPIQSTDSIDYKLVSVEPIGDKKLISFTSNNNQVNSIEVIKGVNPSVNIDQFVMNDYHSSQLVDMMLNHSSGHDFALVGPTGCGKTELIKKFASLLDYNMQTVYLYKDMSSRDLIQQRITLSNGDTKWHNSPLIEAAVNGDLVVLDGIHRMKDDTLMSLRRLIQDRELDLLDGSKLLRHDKYDDLMKDLYKQNIDKSTVKAMRIHPSFRIIATAEPPLAKSSFNDKTSQSTEWLNSEVLNLFLYQTIEPLDIKYEYEILSKKFKLNKKHDLLLGLMEKLKQSGEEDTQLRHVSKLFSLRKLIRLSNKLEKYENLDLKELIENASLYKFMTSLNKQILNEFLTSNNLGPAGSQAFETLFENKLEDTQTQTQTAHKTLSELAKIPDTLFYENNLHTIILNNLIRDFNLGEHLLLIGNQGTGKNKLVDKFLMLTKKPREYIQLHRDTTVHSLTVQPVIKNGVIHYEDSALVKAIKEGHVLVIDEADKAPLHVTCILKSLVESGEMILSDGRRIVNSNFIFNDKDKEKFIKIHKNFRMIILANRPGFPFLGNDFFSILGDLLSCHPIDNPDPQSETEMLRMYAPNVSDKILSKLVSAFGSLRQLSDQGLISYPYSTREIVNIVKHLEKFPQDSLANVLANVYDFDHFSETSDLKSTFKEVMHKHGIPIGSSSFQINLAKTFSLPDVVPYKNSLIIDKIDLKQSSVASLMGLDWKNMCKEIRVDRFKVEEFEARVDSFSELRSSWSLNNKQKLISDMIVVNNMDNDLVYVCGIKPLSVIQLDINTGEAIEMNLNDHFASAWRTYYPRLKLFEVKGDPLSVLLYEETTNDLYKIDFGSMEVSTLEKKLLKGSGLIDSAKKTISKYFIDQNQTYKMLALDKNKYVSWKSNSNQIRFTDLNTSLEINFNLENLFDGSVKLRVNNLVKLNTGTLLITGYDASEVVNSEQLQTQNLRYFILKYPNDFHKTTNFEEIQNSFSLYMIDKSLVGAHDDLLLSQIQIREQVTKSDAPEALKEVLEGSNDRSESLIMPSIKNHFVFVQSSSSNNSNLKSYICKRETQLRDKSNFRFGNLSPLVKSIVDLENNKILTQITKDARPSMLKEEFVSDCLGYIELIDLRDKSIRYLKVPKQLNQDRDSHSNFSVINEANFLVDLSPSKSGNIYTLDFNGNLNEWETSKLALKRSLDDWQKIIMDKQSDPLKLEVFKDSPNSKLKDFNGPKHGKVDETNAPHVGGNTWAGGSGGFDTAGLGGVGGPYRLDSGNQVFQISDQLKDSVPESVRKAAREMGEKVFRERLKEIQMSEYEHDIYSKYLNNVKKPIQQLRNILDSLEAKNKERQWLKNQTQGDLDDSKLVEAIIGEKNVYRRRGEDQNADNGFNIEKPKRLKIVVDVSGSMYRFNGVDNRLERELESVLMVMEAFNGYENKILYDIVGHSGDGFDIKFVDAKSPPRNEAERLKVLKTLLAHSQFCSSGDHTFEATKHAIKDVAKEDADDYFVIALSDANFDRYGLSPKSFSKIMLDTEPKVNVFCIFIGTLGNQAAYLKKSLPSNKAFVCLNTQDVPKIMQQIFQSAMLA